MNTPKPARPRAVYQVTFTLEVALSSEDMERYKNDDDDVLVDSSSTDALVGASGSIFGVLAAAAMLFPRLVGFVCTYAAIEIGCLLIGTSGSVSAACHVGGFATGFVTILFFRRSELHG